MGDRFQVVIERDVRRELGIQPGDRAVETVEHGRLVITFLPARHRRSLLGRLTGTGEIDDFADYRDGDVLTDLLAGEEAERSR